MVNAPFVNFLAHTYLSFEQPAIIVGNYLGDFVKKKEIERLPSDVKHGIFLHRKIDHFTDQHPVVKAGTKHLHKRVGKYAPVVLDIYFDFLLSNRWDEYSDKDLPDFCREAYDALIAYQGVMPVPIASRMKKMVADRWLENYKTYAGLQRVFNFLDRRAKYAGDLTTVPHFLKKKEYKLRQIFDEFFPELVDFVQTEMGLV